MGSGFQRGSATSGNWSSLNLYFFRYNEKRSSLQTLNLMILSLFPYPYFLFFPFLLPLLPDMAQNLLHTSMLFLKDLKLYALTARIFQRESSHGILCAASDQLFKSSKRKSWFSWIVHRKALAYMGQNYRNTPLFRIQVSGNPKIQLTTSFGEKVWFQKFFPKRFFWMHIQFIKHNHILQTFLISQLYDENWRQSIKDYIRDQKD